MLLVPLRTLFLASDLSPAALTDLLRQAIGRDPAKPFSGSVAGAGFVITRLRDFRSTAMPVLRGAIAPAPGGGTRVRLRLAPAAVVVVFMAIWLGFLMTIAGVIVAAHALGAGRSLSWLLAPAALAAVSWHAMTSVFDADARWAVDHVLTRVPALRRDGSTRKSGVARSKIPRVRADSGTPERRNLSGNQASMDNMRQA